ncbi:MAG: hypothetical protein ACREIF_17915 [Chthoniobacterales bacterium]
MRIPNFGYHLARWEANLRRKSFRASLPAIVGTSLPVSRSLPLDVYSYSSEAMLPEQVRSIRSLLLHAGRPNRLTVVSDGTHTAQSMALLERIDPVVSVRPAQEYCPADLPERFRSYVTTHPAGKQLALIMSLPRSGPALYMDSDILFFAGAVDLTRDARSTHAPALYLPDCQGSSVDLRVLRQPIEAGNPVNCGLLMLFRPLDWSLGIRRFLELEGEPDFFTNQTLIHLVMHANDARPLDGRRYVLQLDDQFIYPDRHADGQLVLRHYVNPVRHKFWNA